MRKQLWVGLAVFCLLGALVVFITTSTSKASARYFTALGLELTGIVTKKKVLSNDSGVLCLKVSTSNIANYDIRKGIKPYYCVVKNGEAEIIEGGLSEVEVGDSVVISCRKDSVFYFRNRVKYRNTSLYLRQAALDPMKWDIIKLFDI